MSAFTNSNGIKTQMDPNSYGIIGMTPTLSFSEPAHFILKYISLSQTTLSLKILKKKNRKLKFLTAFRGKTDYSTTI